MKLFLAEKPSVSRTLKEILEPTAKAHKISQYSTYYEGQNNIFAAAAGHLFALKEPQEIDPRYKKWNLDDLPMNLPLDYPLKPNEKSSRYDPKIFETIQKLATRNDIDEIIVCTDPDREGQLIWGYIEEMLPPLKAKITRAWFKEWSPEVMKQCIDDRQDNANYHLLEQAGRCRAIGDAIEGFNDSRAATCKLSNGTELISLGRVQTFVQYLVYQREQQIQHFVPEHYSVVSMDVEVDENGSKQLCTLKQETKQNLTREEAEELKKRCLQHSEVILHTETKQLTQNVLKLYSTTEIQKDMNKRYGLSANETSDILQKLYSPEYALTTYPRTDVKEISSSNAKLHALDALGNLRGCGLFDAQIEKVFDEGWQISPFVISKQETLPHEAITPVFGSISKAKLQKLTDKEKLVYKAIVERYLQAFYPKAVFSETKVSTELEDATFSTKGKILLEAGYLEIVGIGNDTILPAIQDGRSYPLSEVKIEDKETTPPSRFTEATLLEAMENAGRYVDDKEEAKMLKEVKGVGTGATRKGIIETLYKRNYIYKKGKTIYPSDKTNEIFAVLPDTPLTSASQTAQMEMMLDDIQEGKMTPQEYYDVVLERTKKLCDALRSMKGTITMVHAVSTSTNGKNRGESIGKCPICGGDVVKTPKGYGCANWRNGCKFMIWEELLGKKLTEKNVIDLLAGKTTSEIKGFTSQNGKKFSARLRMNEEHKIEFVFENSKEDVKKIVGKCPKCGCDVIEKEKGYLCSGFRNGCKVAIWKNAFEKRGKKKISFAEAKKLLAGESVEMKFKKIDGGKEYRIHVWFDPTSNRLETFFKDK